jgi:RND family efflux transporter MFP subunit
MKDFENRESSMRMKRATFSAAVGESLLLFILLFLNLSCSPAARTAAASDPTEAVAARVTRTARRNLSRDLILAAEFRPFQEIDVHAKVAGYLKTIFVDVGDRVKEGQALATLEIPELQAEVVEAEAAVKRNEQEIKRAQGELDRATSAHEATHLANTRLQSVIRTMPKLVAQQDIDEAHGRDLVAEAQIDAAKAALASAQQQLEVSKAAFGRTKSMFSYAQITAPFAGVITKRYADTGAMIQAGTNSNTQAMPIVRLSQNNLLRLIIPVPESAVPNVHLGSNVKVRVPVLNKSFQGVVARFADRLDLTTRTMDTEIDVPNPRLELVHGMYADATISLEERKNVIVLPVEALNRHGDQTTVFRIGSGNRVEEQPVKLGLETPTLVEVLTGLKDGDLVVVGGQSQLRPGQKVEPKVTEANAVQEES